MTEGKAALHVAGEQRQRRNACMAYAMTGGKTMPSSMDDLFSFLTQLMTQHASLSRHGPEHVSRLRRDSNLLDRDQTALHRREEDR